jgi:hypothetical protein
MRKFRGGARAGSALIALLALQPFSRPAGAQGAVPDISGTYWASEYNAKIAPLGGGELPFTADGKTAYGT